MHAGHVETLLILDCNPVYDAPADLEFAQRARTRASPIHLGLYVDETAAHCAWHIPATHELETWSDARAFEGTAHHPTATDRSALWGYVRDELLGF